MTICIISDAHLFHPKAITPKEYNELLVNIQSCVDIFVDCGDLTDKSNLTAAQIDELSQVYKNIIKPVYVVSGNHDTLSGTTVASLFRLQKNIKVITEPSIIDDMLFIPYTDNIKDLCYKLYHKIEKPVQFAFSHLNVTNNVYATLPIKEVNVLYKFADTYFNGHVHTPEKSESIYGNFYNVGSCSSLTYGDEHFPCYTLFTTKTKERITKIIENSLVHKTFRTDCPIIDTLELITTSPTYAKHQFCFRFLLPNNNSSLELRREIKDYCNKDERIKEVRFDYIKNNQENQKLKEIQQKTKDNKPLIMQLFEQYENDCQNLSEELKKELLQI